MTKLKQKWYCGKCMKQYDLSEVAQNCCYKWKVKVGANVLPKNYTGWFCINCGSTNCGKACEGIRCRECISTNTIYLKKGKRLSKQEEMNALMIRIGLRTVNPFGGNFDGMKGK